MRGNQGQLCANFEGGTHEYFSQQQLWWLVESKKVEGEALRAFDEKYLLTPAVSDLYQAGITCLEMYACFFAFRDRQRAVGAQGCRGPMCGTHARLRIRQVLAGANRGLAL